MCSYNISSFIKCGLIDNCHPCELKASSIVLCLVASLVAMQVVHFSTPPPNDCQLEKIN